MYAASSSSFSMAQQIPLEGDPTRSDRPGDMYEVVGDGHKTLGE